MPTRTLDRNSWPGFEKAAAGTPLSTLRASSFKAKTPGVRIGAPGIDRALPGGSLPFGRVHEVRGDEAATGFCARLLVRAAKSWRGAGEGALLWLARGSDLYAPGIAQYGLEAGRLIVVSGLKRPRDMLWAFEEALRCSAVAAVVAELERAGAAASRRLMLAARDGGALGLALARGERRGVALPTAFSRWSVVAHPAVWRVRVLHCRGAGPSVHAIAAPLL